MTCSTYRMAKLFILFAGITSLILTNWSTKSAEAAARGLVHGGYSIIVSPNSTVYIGGTFHKAGGKHTNNIAKWDGKSWSSLGSGCELEGVLTLALNYDGILYAGGWITEAGGKPVKSAAKWDGKSWSPMGTEMEHVEKILVAPDGKIYAKGLIGNESYYSVAQYIQNKWVPLGDKSLFVDPADIALGPDGTLYAAKSAQVFKWDGNGWENIEGNVAQANAEYLINILALSPEGAVYLASCSLNNDLHNFKKWNGTKWEDVKIQTKGIVCQIEFTKDGTMYVMTIDKKKSTIFYISKFDGKRFTTIIKDTKNFIDTFKIGPDNALYAVGCFNANGKANKEFYAAKWDGGQWNTMELGVTD